MFDLDKRVAGNSMVMKAHSDLSLLRAIAQDRDHAAFSELFERHKVRAYSLALFILQNSALAEDAVQEAMLSIWRSSNLISEEVDAIGWILRIVAARCFDLTRSRKRRIRREQRKACERNDSEGGMDKIENREAIAVLKSHLKVLPALECQLLACCYGAGMPHQEIAELIGIPRSTVTKKIQQALERLRSQLTKAGIAAAAPILSADIIFEATTTGYKCPSGLTERVMSSISNAGSAAAKTFTHHAAATKSNRGALVLGVAIVAAAVLALAGGLWLNQSGPKSNSELAAVPAIPPAAPMTATPLPEKSVSARVARTWDFNAPDATKEIKVVSGSWHWVPNGGPDGSGCMETAGENFRAELDVPIGKLPILIAFRSHYLSPSSETGSGVLWDDHPPSARIRISQPVRSPKEWLFDWIPIYVQITERCIVRSRGDLLLTVNLVARKAPDSRLSIVLSGPQRIDDLTVEEIAPDKVPDVSRFIDAIEKIKPSMRVGTVVLPESKSPRPGQPVSVTFFAETGEPKVNK